MRYAVTYELNGDGRWTVYCTDDAVKGALSQGRTIEAAEANIKEAIALVLDLPDGAEDDLELDSTFMTGDVDYDSQIAEIREVNHQLDALVWRRTELFRSATTRNPPGVSTRDLGRILGVSAGRVSQVRKEAADA